MPTKDEPLGSCHYCESSGDGRDRWDGYGPAIDYCYEREEDGSFWAGNGEYGSRVNFCPFCGAKAPSQMEDDDGNE